MGKRFVRMLLVLGLLISLFVVSASAAENLISSGKCGENVAWKLNASGRLVISGTGDMYDYNAPPLWSMFYQDKVTCVYISDGVTSICNYAFKNCNNLLEITIPQSVTSIGTEAFYGCKRLAEINIPEGVTSIEDDTFYDCENISEIVIPEGVERIGNRAFWNCASLLSITIPKGVTDIEYMAFAKCIKLGNVIISEGIERIGSYSFAYCGEITTMILPDSVSSIGNNAFDSCSNLAEINIPKGVTNIGSYAFYDCKELSMIAIPETVTEIGMNAFCGCTNLSSVTFEGCRPNAGSGAFRQVSATAYYPVDNNTWEAVTKDKDFCDGVFTWVPKIFNGIIAGGKCGSPIWKLDEEGNLTITGNGAIYNYSKNDTRWCGKELDIKSVTIEDGITRIGNNAFADCFNIGKIKIPESVTWIGDSAFNGCMNLSDVNLPQGITNIGASAFANCNSLEEVCLPSQLTSIPYEMFASCCNLIRCQIPDAVTSIGARAFRGCESLMEITIPEGISQIMGYTFCGCRSLETLNMSSNVTNIGDNAFSGCEHLTEVTLPRTVTDIGNSAFEGCLSLQIITIPDSVDNIGDAAFKECVMLSAIYFDGTAPQIGDAAFKSVTATAFYPGNDDTWNSDVKKNYGGEINWKPTCIKGHVLKKDSALAATCTEYGLTEGTHCILCNTVLIEQQVIPALGHSFTTYVYNNDAAVGVDGTETATCDRCNATDTRTAEGTALSAPSFTDVLPGKYYTDAVLWAVDKGITNGTTTTTFSPNATCNRGQIVVFLWRMAGEPMAQNRVNPFTDVKEGDFCYEAVLWAVEKGITNGTTATTFSPRATCNRGQIVTFLWRYAGKPTPQNQTRQFTDVAAGSFCDQAVMWAVENEITLGTTTTTFEPRKDCTRGHAVTFLYRGRDLLD